MGADLARICWWCSKVESFGASTGKLPAAWRASRQTSTSKLGPQTRLLASRVEPSWCPTPQSIVKTKNSQRPGFLSPPSLFKPHPLARQIAIRSHTRREQHLGACSLTKSFGRKSPDTCSSLRRLRKRAAIEAPRLISVASSLSVFSSPAHREVVRQSLHPPTCSRSHSRAGDHMDEDMSPRSGCLGRAPCIRRRGVVRWWCSRW